MFARKAQLSKKLRPKSPIVRGNRRPSSPFGTPALPAFEPVGPIAAYHSKEGIGGMAEDGGLRKSQAAPARGMRTIRCPGAAVPRIALATAAGSLKRQIESGRHALHPDAPLVEEGLWMSRPHERQACDLRRVDVRVDLGTWTEHAA